ncbi:hypothetical protein ACOME3_001593 [Neoechinorhynchus agilis]
MSWQAYIDKIKEIQGVNQAGIYGLDGNPWCESSNFKMDSSQVQLLIQGTSDFEKISDGITVGDGRYIAVRTCGEFCVLKLGAAGLVAFKANSCILIATHDDTVKSELVANNLGSLRDYFVKLGY